jgi:V/A-type H+-transporting ATPase subunit E
MSQKPSKAYIPGTEDALRDAILEEAKGEANQILTDAESQAAHIQQQVQAEINTERETILQRAQEEAEELRSHAAAVAQLEAQTLKLKRREQLLERVFVNTRQRLASAPQWPDYKQIVHNLIREAVERLNVDEATVQADKETQQLLDDEMLNVLEKESGARLHIGEPLNEGTGVVLETLDGHRRYDNTLETRLARMQDELRAPVYHTLMGEARAIRAEMPF